MNDIFRMLKGGKKVQPRALSPSRLPFRTEGEIKSFSDKQKLKHLITTEPAFQAMLKRLL